MMALNRSRIWFGIFVLLVFFLGLATGLAIDRFAGGGRRPLRALGGMGPGPRPAAMAERMSRELELTDTQRQQLEEVFRRGAGRLEQFRQDNRQQFITLSRQLNSEIEAVLTPEQREKFRDLRRRRPWRGERPRMRP